MKDHVTSLETSRKLKDAGVNHSHSFIWWRSVRSTPGKWHLHYNNFKEKIRIEGIETVPAYLLSELLAMVEGEGSINTGVGKPVCILEDESAEVGYFYDDTPCEAVAQAILWQRKNHA